MKYELAKELKDAGFPKKYGWVTEEDGSLRECGANLEIELSELIEACGPHFQQLGIENGKWYAIVSKEDEDTTYSRSHYDTPDEALVSLWIAMNKKV